VYSQANNDHRFSFDSDSAPLCGLAELKVIPHAMKPLKQAGYTPVLIDSTNLRPFPLE